MHNGDVIFRPAREGDLPAIVALITDEDGTGPRLAHVDHAYRAAFEAVQSDPRNEMLVADDDGEVVGCLQSTYIPGLGGHGRERAHLEAVRVRADHRNAGLGREMLRHAV